ncbi:MAG: ScyD/ScyE family protein, partial [Acidimicrobiales bacterium]
PAAGEDRTGGDDAADHGGGVRELTVIATGLDNPRGLDLRGTRLYVAEAGRGGDGPCVLTNQGTEECLDRSGAVTQITRSGQRRVLTGLASLAGIEGGFAVGPDDVAHCFGRILTSVGAGGGVPDTAVRDSLGDDGISLGQIMVRRGQRSRPHRGVLPFADLLAFEELNNPQTDELETDATGLLCDRNTLYAADAGANDLLAIDRRGRISVVAVFPNRNVPLPDGSIRAMQSVPTSVAKGPDGALYVGELTGVPFPKGGARVYRVVPGHEPEIYADGFTNITDIGFDRDGNLYVLQISTEGLLAGDFGGRLIQVAPDGTRTVLLDGDDLNAPFGLAISRRGEIFVSNCSICAGAGEVLRLAPPQRR